MGEFMDSLRRDWWYYGLVILIVLSILIFFTTLIIDIVNDQKNENFSSKPNDEQIDKIASDLEKNKDALQLGFDYSILHTQN